MKQFLLVGIAVLFVSANASENPFDLKENFGKIDSNQEVLLSELRKLAELKELAQEKEATAEVKRVVPPVAREEPSPVLSEVVEEAEAQTPKTVEAPAIPTPPMEEETISQSTDAVMDEEAVANEGFEEIRHKVTESEKKKSEVQETAKLETEKQEAADEKVKIQQVEDARIEEENKILAASIKEKEAEIVKVKVKVKAQREAEKLEVEAYEKERAEKLANQAEENAALEKEKLKIANERKNNKLPEELSFLKKLIDIKTTGEHKALKGEPRKTLENIVKEKNNPNYKIDDIRKEFDSLANNQEVAFMAMTYLISKSVVLQESMDSAERERFDAKFKQSSFAQQDDMEKMLKKYPAELRELGFSLVEDILANGIPQLNLDMKMDATFSTDPALEKEPTFEISASTKHDTVVDINITREAVEAKVAADLACAEAVKEMDMED